MGERKVVNKYLPPDFDPSMIPKSRKPKDGLVSVRMMLPFSIQCSNCHTFMYRGRKFNSKKENMEGPGGKYLGIQRFRFYIKCTACARPISFLTDPKHADYEMESGATRNYELRRDERETEEAASKSREEKEKEAPLKALENRVLASQREMREMDALEEIRAMNMRHVRLLSRNHGGNGADGADHDTGGGGNGSGGNGSGGSSISFDEQTRAVLEARDAKRLAATGGKKNKNKKNHEEEEVNDDGLTEEEEALVRSIKFGPPRETTKTVIIQRLDEEDERKIDESRKRQAMMFEKQLEGKNKSSSTMTTSGIDTHQNKRSAAPRHILPTIKVKRKRVSEEKEAESDIGHNDGKIREFKLKKPKEDPSTTGGRDAEDCGSQNKPAAALGGLLGGYGSDSDSD